jgi:protein TonB
MLKAFSKIIGSVLSQDELDKLIFEKRNKDYGAYYLRRNSKKYNFYSLVFSVTGILLISYFLLLYEKMKNEADDPFNIEANYYIDDNYAEIPFEEYLPEPPKSGSKAETSSKIKVTNEEVVDKKQNPDLNSKGNDTVSNNGGNGNLNGTGDGSSNVVKRSYAEFPGGNKMIERYLRENIKYPKECLSKGIGGVVIVSFCINVYGQVTSVSLARGINPLLDVEAVRVVKAMPIWSPAYKNNLAVESWLKLPINFIPNSAVNK